MKYSVPTTVLPVSLLAAGKDCLVVGGGAVALRKIKSLIDAGARVTVVSPALVSDLELLVEQDSIQHIPRLYEQGDIDGKFIVIAATNDPAVNKVVLEQCRQKGILSCAVDGNWHAGNFVSPATVRKDGLTVSVSTGGRSCRRSRLVKSNLEKHVEMVGSAELFILGTSHQFLHIDQREPYHLVGNRLRHAGEMIALIWGVHEFMLLNTCNRFEIIAVVSHKTETDDVLKRILSFDHLQDDQFYLKRGSDAFAHLALVTSGLYSQTPGENNIVAQVKDAFNQALDRGWAGAMMQDWIAAALHISKDIRHATSTLLKPLEIEDLCMEYLDAHSSDSDNRRALVIGSGVMGDGLVRRSLDRFKECDWCYHINKPHIPAEWQSRVRCYSFNGLREHLSECGIVICATASPGFVLHRGHAPFFDQEHQTLIFDLAMPRNVEPELDEVSSGLSIIDLDDLKRWFRHEAVDMQKIHEIAEQTVADHTTKYEKIIAQFQGWSQGE